MLLISSSSSDAIFRRDEFNRIGCQAHIYIIGNNYIAKIKCRNMNINIRRVSPKFRRRAVKREVRNAEKQNHVLLRKTLPCLLIVFSFLVLFSPLLDRALFFYSRISRAERSGEIRATIRMCHPCVDLNVTDRQTS